MIHAVRGLAAHVENRAVRERLLLEVEYEGRPEKVRSAAVRALASGFREIPGDSADAVLARVRGVAKDLEDSGESPELLAQLEDEFRRHWEGTDAAGSPAAVLMTR
jgi:hypothetical protein